MFLIILRLSFFPVGRDCTWGGYTKIYAFSLLLFFRVAFLHLFLSVGLSFSCCVCVFLAGCSPFLSLVLGEVLGLVLVMVPEKERLPVCSGLSSSCLLSFYLKWFSVSLTKIPTLLFFFDLPSPPWVSCVKRLVWIAGV